MRIITTNIVGASPYSQSRPHFAEKKDKESADQYEKRTWANRLHVDGDQVYIPPMALKNCLAEAAKFLSVQIPGKGKATYTKHFEAGVMVQDPIPLFSQNDGAPISPDDCEGEWLYVPSDGRRGGGNRVMRCYPKIENWCGAATIYVLDETITDDVLRHHLRQAGQFIGLGRFRPRNNGYYGRFSFDDFESRELDEVA